MCTTAATASNAQLKAGSRNSKYFSLRGHIDDLASSIQQKPISQKTALGIVNQLQELGDSIFDIGELEHSDALKHDGNIITKLAPQLGNGTEPGVTLLAAVEDAEHKMSDLDHKEARATFEWLSPTELIDSKLDILAVKVRSSKVYVGSKKRQIQLYKDILFIQEQLFNGNLKAKDQIDESKLSDAMLDPESVEGICPLLGRLHPQRDLVGNISKRELKQRLKQLRGKAKHLEKVPEQARVTPDLDSCTVNVEVNPVVTSLLLDDQTAADFKVVPILSPKQGTHNWTPGDYFMQSFDIVRDANCSVHFETALGNILNSQHMQEDSVAKFKVVPIIIANTDIDGELQRHFKTPKTSPVKLSPELLAQCGQQPRFLRH